MYVYKHAYLKRLYNRYNHKFFEGKLPDIVVGYATTVQFKRHRVKRGTCAFTCFDEVVRRRPTAIVVHRSKSKSSTYVKADLLHEMCHVSVPRAEHGKVFQDEMKRIANAGAFKGIW